jgi:hypothetical protein
MQMQFEDFLRYFIKLLIFNEKNFKQPYLPHNQQNTATYSHTKKTSPHLPTEYVFSVIEQQIHRGVSV